jgi:TP901 family phage tail tape measure protein
VPLLPPVEQAFTASATDFLATVDDMLAKLDELSVKLDQVAASSDRIGAASEGNDEFAASIDRLSESVTGLEGRLDGLEGTLGSLTDTIEANTAAVDENSAAMDTQAGSAERAAGASEGMAASGKLAFLALGAALVYSVAKAGEYQSQMTTLLTQAGVAKSQFKTLENGVLQLAGQVGFSPTSLSQALYHVESSFQSIGITGPKALDLLKIAAEGAATGHADLVDVTNALDATIASGVGGIKNYSQAMGALNSIVGSGDMTMEDLATALGTGVMAVAKSYGQTIYQVGAALATFGDNNIRGAKAATDLRMAWQAVQSPLATGVGVLNRLGLGAHTLAQTMTHHGLTAAIDQFIAHLKSSHVPMSEWGMLETEIFGKRAGVGLGVLIDQIGRLQGKLPDIKKGADDFGNAWKTTTKTVSQQWKDFRAGLDSVVIELGSLFLPAAMKVLDALNHIFQVIMKSPTLRILAGAFVAVAVAMGVAATATAALTAVMAINPVVAITLAVIALAAGLYELYKHCKIVRDAVADVAGFFKSAWKDAMTTAGAVVHWFTSGPLAFVKQQLAVFRQFWQQQHAEIEKIAKVVWDLIGTEIKVAITVIQGVISVALDVIETAWKASWVVVYNVVKTVWDIIAAVISSTIREILDVISIILDLLQGKWGAAWDKVKDLASTAIHEALTVIHDILSGFISIMVGLGRDLIEGLIKGIKAEFGTVEGVVKDLAGGIINTAKSVLHIFSPSKDMEEIGLMTGAGLVKGLEGTASDVKSAAEKLTEAIQDAFKDSDIGYGEASYLTTMVQKDNTKLQGLANQRADILSKIKTAENYASSTASNAISSASLSNIVSAMPSGSVVTSFGLASGLSADLTQINQFSAAVKRLGKLGLNKNLLNQIIQAGPAQGLPIAQALLNGPVSEIQSLNKTETAIASAATSLGDTAADAMYDSGKDAGKGFLSGLKGQEKAIDDVMKKIADTLVKRVRKDLGISSPSKVFYDHGLAVAQGFAGGMNAGRPLVEAAGARLSAAARAGLGPAAAGAGGGGGDVHYDVKIQITVPGGFIGSDAQFLAKLSPVVQKAILQLEKRNPTAQTVLPH